MGEAGILDEDEPVELLDRVLVATNAKSPPHETVVLRLGRWLAPLVVAGAHDVRRESPIVVPDRTSLPEPDLAVHVRDDAVRHPTTALLAIEVAVSSLRTDLAVKPRLYAAAAVPEYWVVDVEGQRLERFTRPGAGGYLHRETITAPALVVPLAVPDEPLDLSMVFAGL